MIKALGDQVLLIISFILAFLLRVAIGHFPNESPAQFLTGYFWMLLSLCIFYLFLFWILGYYENKTSRAVLEEILGVFGVITLGAVILLTAMYLRKDLWVSRGIIFLFWTFSSLGIGSFHVFLKNRSRAKNQAVPQAKMATLNRRIELKAKGIKLGIVTVNTNDLDKLTELLRSLREAKLGFDHQIVVVDNHSSDGSREYLEKLPEVKLVRNDKNLGYPSAVNKGIQALPGYDYYFILNPDISVPQGAIETALNFMEEHKENGLVGCKLLNPDGSLQYSARTFYSLRTALYRFTPLRGLLAGSSIERDFLMMDWDHNNNREVDWVLGGCMLVRERVVEEVGFMDERIFLYFDDVDWCYRIWKAGWKVYYLADSIMIHKHIRKSANNIMSRAAREHVKSLIYYLWKYKFRLMPPNCPSSRDIS